MAYKQPIADPGEFALDAIDVTGDRRPARLWNCPAVIATATGGARPALHLVNYGSPVRGRVLARRYGVFRSAMLHRPEEPDLALPVSRRGAGTEVVLPGMNRVATVVFQ